MNTFRCFFVLLPLILLCSCVSSKEYKARLSEIDDLRSEKLALNEELGKKNSDISTLNEEAEELNRKFEEVADSERKLRKENADLRHMLEANKLELTRDLMDTKLELDNRNLLLNSIEEELSAKSERVEELEDSLDKLQEEKRKALEEKKNAVAELTTTYDGVVESLKEEIDKGRIEVTMLKDKLSLSMVDKILFDSGSVKIKKGGRGVLDRVAEVLNKTKDKEIRIEGHTDNVPIGPDLKNKFPTNWELSTARATNVVRYLQDKAGVDPKRLSASGYGEYKPVASNETEEGKTKNRRIEIILIPIEIADDIPPAEMGSMPE